jgi:hypothetical protein
MRVLVRAVITALLIGLIGANVWLPLLVTLGVPLAAAVEVGFLSPVRFYGSAPR